MKNDIWFITIICLLVTFADLKSQVLQNEDVILQPSELLIDNSGGDVNSTYVNQEGRSNEITIIQERAEGDLLENLIRILQNGQENVAIVSQKGSDNQLALIQSGNHNIYDLISDGSEIEISVIQDGLRNEILQRIENSQDVYVEFEQRGNDNSIIHEISGVQGQSFIIRQIGDEMSVTIRQSNY